MSEDVFHEVMGGMLRQISGQLRLSMGSAMQALEALAPPERREEDPETDASAALLCRSWCRLLRLAGNLEGLAGAEELRLVNGDIVGLCREVMRRAAYPAELLGVTLAFESGRSSHIIAMDGGQLERLLLNLLSNAFRATPRGGTAALEVRVEKELVLLILTDTGAGISPAELEAVFSRWMQPERVEPPHGLGLGLPICRSIAQAHGGGIVLASREGGGTAVTVSLPNRKLPEGQETDGLERDWTGGFNRILVELADVLPKEAFAQRFWD